MSYSDLLKKIDIFAEPPNLNIDGQVKYRSKTGALFTLIYATALVSVIVVQLMGFFDTSSPLTSTDTYTRDVYPRINLREHKIVPSIIGYSDEVTLIPVDELNYYMTLGAFLVRWVPTSDPNDSAANTEKLFERIDLIPCRELYEKSPELFDYYQKDDTPIQILQEYGLCINANDDRFRVDGQLTADLWEYISIFIRPCSQVTVFNNPDGTTSETTNCATADDINKLNFVVSTPIGSYKAAQKNNPLKLIPNFDEVFYVNTFANQQYTTKVGETSVMDYTGILPAWSFTQKLFGIESSIYSITNRNTQRTTCTPKQALDFENEIDCPSYFTYMIQSSGKVHINKRTYVSLVDILSTVGGINNVLMIVLQLIYKKINVRKRNIHLVNTVYPLIFHSKQYRDCEKGGVFARRGGRKKSLKKSFTGIEEPRRCCCKKKSTDGGFTSEEEETMKRKMALERIHSCLDVKSLVENSYKLQVLSKIFLEERHQGLAQIVDINLWKEKRKKDDANKEEEERQLKAQKANFFNRTSKLKWIRVDMAHKKSKGYKEEVDRNLNEHQNLVSDIDRRLDVFIDSFFDKKLKDKNNILLEELPADLTEGLQMMLPQISELHTLKELGKESDGELREGTNHENESDLNAVYSGQSSQFNGEGKAYSVPMSVVQRTRLRNGKTQIN